MIQVDEQLLLKFAEFTGVVMGEIKSLRSQLSQQMQKAAAHDTAKSQYQQSVIKVAEALYNSDFDLVTGDFDRRKFIKRAMEDPSYLAQTLEKVCNAADVSLIGKPARVAANKKLASYDPVYARAFGFDKSSEDVLVDW